MNRRERERQELDGGWLLYQQLGPSGPEGEPQHAYALNLSEGGLLIHTPDPLEVGTQLLVELYTELLAEGIPAQVEVRWCEESAEAPDQFNVGTTFVWVLSHTMEALRDELSELSPR